MELYKCPQTKIKKLLLKPNMFFKNAEDNKGKLFWNVITYYIILYESNLSIKKYEII